MDSPKLQRSEVHEEFLSGEVGDVNDSFTRNLVGIGIPHSEF